MKKRSVVAGIGELLWDIFPGQQRIGGAPANFAFHCRQLGADAYPVSCVGADPLGHSIRDSLEEMGMDPTYVMVSDSSPTGTVQVSLNDHGKPTYKILENVAWDHIPFTTELQTLAASLDAVCFGSLSQRSAESRATIQSFLRQMPDNALRIFDVNLRQPFFSKERIEESLQLANILKLSDEELPVLADYFGLRGDSMEQLHQLRAQFGLRMIAYTRGADGSVLVGVYEVDDAPGQPGLAIDSVGAGDSFTAALCVGLLKGWHLQRLNTFANEVASFVCSQNGATPVLPDSLVGVETKTENKEQA